MSVSGGFDKLCVGYGLVVVGVGGCIPGYVKWATFQNIYHFYNVS